MSIIRLATSDLILRGSIVIDASLLCVVAGRPTNCIREFDDHTVERILGYSLLKQGHDNFF